MGKWLLGNQQLLGNKHSPCQDKHVLSGSRLCICCRAGSDASWQLCAAGCEVAFYLRLDILCLTERLRGLHHTSWHALRTLVGLETMHSMRMIFTTPSRSACQHRRHPGELTALLVQSANVKLAAHFRMVARLGPFWLKGGSGSFISVASVPECVPFACRLWQASFAPLCRWTALQQVSLRQSLLCPEAGPTTKAYVACLLEYPQTTLPAPCLIRC